jgi:hypothetical protein
MTEEPKGLPQSSLLTKADPEWSMAELFNREPLALYQQHPEQFKRLILELRAQAERNRMAEESGRRVPRPAKLAEVLPVKTLLTAEELLFGDDK